MECVFFWYFFFLEGCYSLVFVMIVILRTCLSKTLDYYVFIGQEILLNFLMACNTFSFIFEFRNGLHWVANVFVIENKMCVYCNGRVCLKSEIRHFTMYLVGFCEIKYSDKAISKGILRSAHITKILWCPFLCWISLMLF